MNNSYGKLLCENVGPVTGKSMALLLMGLFPSMALRSEASGSTNGSPTNNNTMEEFFLTTEGVDFSEVHDATGDDGTSTAATQPPNADDDTGDKAAEEVRQKTIVQKIINLKNI